MELAILLTLITAVVGPIIVARYRHYLHQKSKQDPVASSLKSNMLVDEQLEALKQELDSCRIWISQFHNGGNFYPTGKSIQKFSIFVKTKVLKCPQVKKFCVCRLRCKSS